MKKILMVLCIVLGFIGPLHADTNSQPDTLGFKYVSEPKGKVLEVGMLYKGTGTGISRSSNIYYTVWCIGGDVFLATKSYGFDFDASKKKVIHPFTDNLTGIMDRNHALACGRFETLSFYKFSKS